MKVENIDGFSLGIVEKSGTKRDGTEYSYFRFGYVVKGENESRQMYVESTDYTLKRMCKEVSTWGTPFVFSGEIDAKGNIVIEEIREKGIIDE